MHACIHAYMYIAEVCVRERLVAIGGLGLLETAGTEVLAVHLHGEQLACREQYDTYAEES